jgi:hypothetical protein
VERLALFLDVRAHLAARKMAAISAAALSRLPADEQERRMAAFNDSVAALALGAKEGK